MSSDAATQEMPELGARIETLAQMFTELLAPQSGASAEARANAERALDVTAMIGDAAALTERCVEVLALGDLLPATPKRVFAMIAQRTDVDLEAIYAGLLGFIRELAATDRAVDVQPGVSLMHIDMPDVDAPLTDEQFELLEPTIHKVLYSCDLCTPGGARLAAMVHVRAWVPCNDDDFFEYCHGAAHGEWRLMLARLLRSPRCAAVSNLDLMRLLYSTLPDATRALMPALPADAGNVRALEGVVVHILRRCSRVVRDGSLGPSDARALPLGSYMPTQHMLVLLTVFIDVVDAVRTSDAELAGGVWSMRRKFQVDAHLRWLWRQALVRTRSAERLDALDMASVFTAPRAGPVVRAYALRALVRAQVSPTLLSNQPSVQPHEAAECERALAFAYLERAPLVTEALHVALRHADQLTVLPLALASATRAQLPLVRQLVAAADPALAVPPALAQRLGALAPPPAPLAEPSDDSDPDDDFNIAALEP